MKLGVVGCKGRLGSLIVEQSLEASDVELVSGAVRLGSDVGQDVGILAGSPPIGVLATDDMSQMAAVSDVLIDVSHPSTTDEVACACKQHGTALVCGVTGHSEAELHILQEVSTNVAVLLAANFSPGLNLLLGLVRKAAASLGTDYDIEIAEMHHRNKVDAPSGTALAIGRAAASGRNVDLNTVACMSREGQVGARSIGEIGFATLRGGSVVGKHTAIFSADREIITLSHEAIDRRIFADGAIRAALWLNECSPGFYKMDDMYA